VAGGLLYGRRLVVEQGVDVLGRELLGARVGGELAGVLESRDLLPDLLKNAVTWTY